MECSDAQLSAKLGADPLKNKYRSAILNKYRSAILWKANCKNLISTSNKALG